MPVTNDGRCQALLFKVWSQEDKQRTSLGSWFVNPVLELHPGATGSDKSQRSVGILLWERSLGFGSQQHEQPLARSPDQTLNDRLLPISALSACLHTAEGCVPVPFLGTESSSILACERSMGPLPSSHLSLGWRSGTGYTLAPEHSWRHKGSL